MILNEEQRNVIESKDQFLFLLAGAGSGKTRVIVEKIKKLVVEGIEPSSILGITFTRKSAQEMKHRMNNEKIHIHTFHQFCYQKLIEVQQNNIQLVEENKIAYSKEELLKITKYKNSLYRLTKPKIYHQYQMELKAKGLKDFDDLMLDFLNLVKKHQYRSNYQYIFIDEFQDTNLLQYEVLKKLITKTTSVLAVGDPDQSIYKFRGANYQIIDQYVKDYHALILTLKINYRSAPNIVYHANELIKHNNRKHKKILYPNKEIQGISKVFKFRDEEEEALFLIEHISSLKKNNVKPFEICILYREHQRSYELQYQLNLFDIPFQVENENSNDLHLMTIHQAKGLEFEVVIIIGLEEGTLPKRNEYTLSEENEERRLMFVAMTRAKSKLYLSYVKINSSNQHQKPSKFIKESKIKIK